MRASSSEGILRKKQKPHRLEALNVPFGDTNYPSVARSQSAESIDGMNQHQSVQYNPVHTLRSGTPPDMYSVHMGGLGHDPFVNNPTSLLHQRKMDDTQNTRRRRRKQHQSGAVSLPRSRRLLQASSMTSLANPPLQHYTSLLIDVPPEVRRRSIQTCVRANRDSTDPPR
jgi:hypothetical protein